MKIRGRSLKLPSIALLAFAVFSSGCGAPPSSFDSSVPLPRFILGEFSAIHGPALIGEGDFFAESEKKPWSGYWYPLSRIDARSALQKYDRLTGRQSLKAEEARINREYRPLLPWEGRCDAWAIASILKPEPVSALEVAFNGKQATFSIAEQKALTIFSHEILEPGDRQIFGQRNDGQGGPAFEDLSPAEFHRILQVMLQDKRRPFIMDRDPLPPVWNTPVSGARWTITRNLHESNRFDVHTWVYAVFPYDSDLDSTERIAPVLEYTYQLVARPTSAGSVVVDSKWTGRSITNHPDFVTILSEDPQSRPHSLNPELDADWVAEHLKE